MLSLIFLLSSAFVVGAITFGMWLSKKTKSIQEQKIEKTINLFKHVYKLSKGGTEEIPKIDLIEDLNTPPIDLNIQLESLKKWRLVKVSRSDVSMTEFGKECIENFGENRVNNLFK